jgi:hypothetical protein
MRKFILILLFIGIASGQVVMRKFNTYSSAPQLTINQSSLATTTITARGTSGDVVTFDWGDGTDSTLTLSGVSTNDVLTKDYSSTGTYTLTLSGDYTSLTLFSCTDGRLEGDVGGLGALTSLTRLYLYNTSVDGDVGGLSTLTSLTRLYLYNTSVDGDVGGLSTLTSLIRLYLYNTSVDGDVGGLSTLTSLTNLSLQGTSVDGDIGGLSTLTSLVLLYLYDNTLSYSSTSLPAWADNDIQVYSTSLSSTEVDSFLIDLADGVGDDGTLNIAGTNDSRTSNSDAAVDSLLDHNWTVTVNE